LIGKNSRLISEISWLLGGLASGVDFEPKDPGFNPQSAQKANTNFNIPPGNHKCYLVK
jgi:hypothetical protein